MHEPVGDEIVRPARLWQRISDEGDRERNARSFKNLIRRDLKGGVVMLPSIVFGDL